MTSRSSLSERLSPDEEAFLLAHGFEYPYSPAGAAQAVLFRLDDQFTVAGLGDRSPSLRTTMALEFIRLLRFSGRAYITQFMAERITFPAGSLGNKMYKTGFETAVSTLRGMCPEGWDQIEQRILYPESDGADCWAIEIICAKHYEEAVPKK